MPFSSDKLSPLAARILPWLVAMTFFMEMLDITILNTALPGMARDLGVEPLTMQPVVIAYILTAALLIPASGWLADRFGTKPIFLLAVSLFTLGSLLCALSGSVGVLTVCRVVQGIGGALMVPVGRLTVLKVYPRSELIQVLSFVTIPGLLGPLMGPVIGGLLVQYASWHWIFLINIPVGIVSLFLTWKVMPDLKENILCRFDVQGFLVFGASMVLITIAMEGLGELDMPKVQATLMCIAGLLLMCFYWMRSARHANPLFSSHLFLTRSFAVGILGNCFARLSSGAMPFLIPLFLQLTLGYSPVKAGLMMMPTAIGGMVGKQFVTPLIRRLGFRPVLMTNTTVLGLMVASFYFLGPNMPTIAMLIMFGFYGVVNSMQFTAMNSLTLIDLPPNEASSGNSLLSVTMQISNVGGVAMGAAVVAGFLASYAALPEAERMLNAFDHTFVWVGVICIGAGLIFSQTPKGAGVALHADDAGKPDTEKIGGPACPIDDVKKDD